MISFDPNAETNSITNFSPRSTPPPHRILEFRKRIISKYLLTMFLLCSSCRNTNPHLGSECTTVHLGGGWWQVCAWVLSWHLVPDPCSSSPAEYYGSVPYRRTFVFPRAAEAQVREIWSTGHTGSLSCQRVGKPDAYIATLSQSHSRRVSPRVSLF